MSSEETESVDFWRKKCQELEKVVRTLSTHCVKVVDKHEQLLTNYKKNEDQYNQLVQKLKEKGDQIKKAKDVLVPVTREYQALKERYEIAMRCQYEAETYATKINRQNKVLKRQSEMLWSRMGSLKVAELKFEDNEEEDGNSGGNAENEYCKKLNQQIEDLTAEKSALSAQVTELHEDYQNEKERTKNLSKRIEAYKNELKHAKNTIAQQESTLQQLAKTSEAAYKEYERLQSSFEREFTARSTVERLAHSLYAEREAARRQSAMLMKDVGSEKKLMEALIEVENLTTQMETMKAEFKDKINALEEELNSMKENSGVEDMEKENSQMMEERDFFQKKLVEAEKATEDLRSQYASLRENYDELEKKYKEAKQPPPPPPPPPPMPVSKTGGFLSKITGGGKKKQKELVGKRLGLAGATVNADYSKAVDEMMKRIKDGSTGLRPVLKKRTQSLPDDESDGSAMKELQGILSKMKKARSEDDLSTFGEPISEQNSELDQVFRRMAQKQTDRPVPAPRKLSTIRDDTED